VIVWSLDVGDRENTIYDASCFLIFFFLSLSFFLPFRVLCLSPESDVQARHTTLARPGLKTPHLLSTSRNHSQSSSRRRCGDVWGRQRPTNERAETDDTVEPRADGLHRYRFCGKKLEPVASVPVCVWFQRLSWAFPYTSDRRKSRKSILGNVSSEFKWRNDAPGSESATGITTLRTITDRSTTQIRYVCYLFLLFPLLLLLG